MKLTAEIYVGENADTNEIEVDRIKDILSSRHHNYIVKGFGEGVWGGVPQEVLMVLITDLEDRVYETFEMLKKELNQDNIAILEENDFHVI